MLRFCFFIVVFLFLFSRIALAEFGRSSVPPEINPQFDAYQQQRQLEQSQAILEQQTTKEAIRIDTEIEEDPTKPLLNLNEACYSINELLLQDIDNEILSLKNDVENIEETEEKKIKKSQFEWALQAAYANGDLTLPYCIGGQGINILVKRIQNAIISKGFITTRVIVTDQDLRTGKLVLTVIPGRVADIYFNDKSGFYPYATALTRWSAFPLSSGDVLNVRDLEQGLENLKNPTHADANIDILPSEREENLPGFSDIKVDYEQKFPARLSFSLDDSGSHSTGRLQGTVTGALENLLTLNDLFYISYTRSFRYYGDELGRRNSNNLSFYYSIPWKYWQLNISSSRYRYSQEIFGNFSNYDYSGISRYLNINLSRLLYRDGNRKITATVGLWHRRSNNFISGTEIEIQRRRVGGWEFGVSYREYINRLILDINVNYRQGTGAYRALIAPEDILGRGTSRPKIITASINVIQPFYLGEQIFQFSSRLRGQYSKRPLVPQDRLNIGSRYTVRGFDGEQILLGDRGFVWRNELAWNYNSRHYFYIGFDQGAVFGPTTDVLSGKHLTGWVTGLRGYLWGINYEGFIGGPINKPQGFRAGKFTAGFNFFYQF